MIDLAALDDALPEGINRAEYWVLNVDGVEWIYVVNSLIKAYIHALPIATRVRDQPSFMVSGGEGLTFFLKRKYVPVAVLAKATGLDEKAIQAKEYLHLRVKDRPDLPKPTVTDWGTA